MKNIVWKLPAPKHFPDAQNRPADSSAYEKTVEQAVGYFSSIFDSLTQPEPVAKSIANGEIVMYESMTDDDIANAIKELEKEMGFRPRN